ncbi:phenylalanine transporter [Klebsiella pneumoniae]|uniref:Phenylalanine transporter n=1 Tax=Klebsiella pneumoniae TaxID=573 RepID=A0A3S4GKY9_KLEPN|nr:phenylalanine transporter [Klebsiella pneumoniae]
MKDASTSSDAVEESGPTLHRGLQNRHIQLIALGGAIGTGLFLGIGPAIQMAGPAVLLGYAVAGIVAFLIMRQLGEMVVEEPVSGSFAHFAYKYWGAVRRLSLRLELLGDVRAGRDGGADRRRDLYAVLASRRAHLGLGGGFPSSLLTPSTWSNVRLYGEAEFWFALIKVLAIIGMIAFGLWMLFGGHGGSKAGFDNLWKHGGFLATGWHGLILSLAVIMFSFGGLELIGITAAEAQNPEKSIPKAVNQVVYRILLFYIGSLVVLLALYPWVEIKSRQQPRL